jgi:hypothetical protein
MYRLRILIALAPGFAFAAPAFQAGLPLAAPVPGGIAIVCVGRAAGPAPQVMFEGQRVLVARVGDAWGAVVGLPLALKPGSHEIAVVQGEKTERTIAFQVARREYDKQYVTLANRRQVEPEPEDLRRIAREQGILVGAFSTFSAFERTRFRGIRVAAVFQQRAKIAPQRTGHCRSGRYADQRAGCRPCA